MNSEKGEKVLVNFQIQDNAGGTVRFSKKDMKIMKAKPGDLVYLSDSRRWLGGLKSIHSIYGEPHDQEGIVYIDKDQNLSGRFDEKFKLEAEKEF